MDIGAQLRTAREARGLSMEAVAHTLRVKARILSAIEHNDLATVPPRPFGRGVVRAYAHEVGLDPDYTAREYFARFAPAPPPAVRPAPAPAAPFRTPLLAAAGALLVIAASTGWLLTHGSTGSPPVRSTSSPQAGSTSSPQVGSASSPQAGSTSSPQVGSTSSPQKGASTDSPQFRAARASRTDPASARATAAGAASPATAGTSGTRAAGGMTLSLTATRVCWVAATADGRRVVYRLLEPGARETITAAHDVVVRTGDAGALMWSLGDAPAREAGRPGEVRTLVFTPQGLRR